MRRRVRRGEGDGGVETRRLALVPQERRRASIAPDSYCGHGCDEATARTRELDGIETILAYVCELSISFYPVNRTVCRRKSALTFWRALMDCVVMRVMFIARPYGAASHVN